MKPKIISVGQVLTAASWESGREFHLTEFREKCAQRAEADGFGLFGHETIEHVWMTYNAQARTYHAAPPERATHIRVTYTRAAASRKVRL